VSTSKIHRHLDFCIFSNVNSHSDDIDGFFQKLGRTQVNIVINYNETPWFASGTFLPGADLVVDVE